MKQLILSALLLASCTTKPTVCIGSSLFESNDGVAVKWTGATCKVKCEIVCKTKYEVNR